MWNLINEKLIALFQIHCSGVYRQNLPQWRYLWTNCRPLKAIFQMLCREEKMHLIHFCQASWIHIMHFGLSLSFLLAYLAKGYCRLIPLRTKDSIKYWHQHKIWNYIVYLSTSETQNGIDTRREKNGKTDCVKNLESTHWAFVILT